VKEMLGKKEGTTCGELATLRRREFRDANFSG
jgi:hypothetical protein